MPNFYIQQNPADETTIANQVRSYLWFIKDKAVLNGWTVKASSTGAAYNSTGDNWTTYADVSSTNLVSWILLESPASIVNAGKVWLVLSYNGSGTAYNATITTHNALPTGGAVNTLPSSTNILTPLSNAQLFSNVLASNRFHACFFSNGTFWTGSSVYSTGTIATFVGILPTFNVIGSYNYNTASIAAYSASGMLNILSGTSSIKMWNHSGTVSTSGGFITGECYINASILKGATLPGGGNRAGNQEATLLNLNNSSEGKVGSLGDGTYNFLGCGSTVLLTGATYGSPITNTFNKNIFLPANAGIA